MEEDINYKEEQTYDEEEYCNLCESAQDLISQIAEHYKIYHADSINYDNFMKTCNCDEIFEMRDMLINHQISHIIQKPKIDVLEEGEDFMLVEYVDDDEEQVIVEDVNIHEQVLVEDKPDTIEFEEYITIEETKELKKCNQCNAQYYSTKSLVSHYQNEHDPSNKMKCPECNNRFNCEKKLRTHLNKHEAEKSYRDGKYFCQICDKQCLTKGRLIAHKQTHYQDFECDYCGKKFTKYEFLQNHVIQHAFGRKRKDPNDLTNKIVCPLCSKLVPKDRMKRHNFIFHSDERPYVCNECGKSFKYSEPYSNHLDMHAQTPKYRCEYCLKMFYNQSNLRQHVYRHTDPDRFKCEFCSERFGSSSSLKMHIKRLHEKNDEKESLQCSDCGKIFKHTTSLKNHINQVHSQKEEVLRKCNYCPYTCFKIKNLLKHTTRVHKIKKRDYRIFPNSEYEDLQE
ncbi:hypothetical protein PVAND_010969 [Polypedilum vanderplanki]|uniref:C2H2-type domain-containing protein n=1 Tax=Polypedilum vanderplanki TaxID=319348 RepID=A0A9J6CHX2_POLVA|nr:hypothetical protein PVAND_010969 [Polypedilum vanderplanki]